MKNVPVISFYLFFKYICSVLTYTINTIKTIARKLKDIYKKIDLYCENNNTKPLWFAVCITIVTLLFYLLNYLHPLINDDWLYSLISVDNPKRIGSFKEILEAQYQQYFNWGGRVPAHIILQTLLWGGKSLANILNTGIYMTYVLAIYHIAMLDKKNKVNIGLFIVINLMIWFLHASIQNSMLWLSGSCNYLWMGTIALLFIIPYCKYFITPVSEQSTWKSFPMFPFGILAGWSNESTALATIFLIALLLVVMKIQKTNIPLWAVCGFIGLIIGFLILYLAPGNYIRAEEVIQHDYAGISTIHRFIKYILKGTTMTSIFMLLPLGLYCVLLLLRKQFGKKVKQLPTLYLSLAFAATSIFCMLTMFAAPVFPDRAIFMPISFLLVAIILIYKDIDFKYDTTKYLNHIIICFACLSFIFQYYYVIRDMSSIKKVSDRRVESINKQLAEGKEHLEVEAFPKQRTRFFITDDLSSDRQGVWNELYATYLGVKSIIAVKDEKKKSNPSD